MTTRVRSKRRLTNLRLMYAAIALLAGVLSPASSFAQSDSSNQNVQELRRQLDELRQQLNQLQARLGELEGTKGTEAANAPAAPSAKQEGTIQSTQPPAQASPSKQIGQATATYTTFSEDNVAAARFDNIPLDPKYKGFFHLPGTQTILKIGGYFKTDFIYDLKPAGNTDSFIPSSIPIPSVVGVNNATVSIRPTRLNLDFRIPTTQLGDVRFFLEGDLFGTNATTPRLRHAYAQVRNVLIGQTFSNFMDPDGFPDTLDFQGPNGMVSIRNPQLRYGFALSPSTTLYVSVEKPSSDITFKTPQFSSQPNAPSPDGVIRLRQEFERGHFQVSALFRSIAAFVPTTPTPKTDSVFGWGVNLSTGLKTFNKDNAIFAVAAGHGISRYLQDTSGLGIDAEPNSSTGLQATPAVGVEAAYQHYWLKTLRSSAIYSYAAVNNTAFFVSAAPGTYNHATYTGSNLIWNPFGSLNVGAEFLYGWATEQNGQKASAPRIQFSAKYSFVKVDPDR
ncbi:MAG TPA: DcaP family trimeric outer membrane transporter [Terriglobales bacterium]|jgi:outer membrane DcaP-like protein|nr:DcaP family trimeric outer membrane transporter [Terriglobales bacterium]